MALSTMEENIRELARQGPNQRSNLSSLMAALNKNKLDTRRFKENIARYERGEAEGTRRFEIERERFSELDALNEELRRANLALSQTASGRADITSEMNRIGSFYPSATSEARRGTREDLIGRDLIPESLLNETMIDPRNTQNQGAYPAAQAGLYASAGGTPTTSRTTNTGTMGGEDLSELINIYQRFARPYGSNEASPWYDPGAGTVYRGLRSKFGNIFGR